MDKKALQLESRFSLPPNSLGYCGRNSAAEKFKQCIIHGKCDGVEEEVSKFIVLYPYLKTLAAITGMPAFSYKIVESYWLGNETLDKARPKDYYVLLKNLAKQGVPDFFIEELKQKEPKVFIPSHLWQVLYVGVGKASGAVPFNLESINNCMIRWGKVKQINNGQLTININGLEKNWKLTKTEETVGYREDFLPGVKVGDEVAVHWKQAVKRLTTREAGNLSYWTGQVLAAV